MAPKINTSYVMFLGITAALGGLLFGFDIAIITGAGPFLAVQFHLSDLSLGFAFSALLFGCVVGAPLGGVVAERFGRCRPLLWVSALFALTSLAMGLAPGFGPFLVARFLGGLAVGGASILAPMYIAEISPPSIRGRLTASYQLAIVIGILGSFLLNYLLKDLGPWTWFNASVADLGSWNWRWMFVSGTLPSVIFFFLLLGAPETPRYLSKAGREPESFAILRRILGEEEALREQAEIRTSLLHPRDSWREMLEDRGLRKALVMAFFLAILVHFSGINTIIDYSPIIFKSAGFSIDLALLSSFGVGIINFLFTLISFWTIDRFGRKRLYVIGSAGMTVSLVALAGAILFNHFYGVIALIVVLSYIAFFASCIGPVFWTLVAEIFPNKAREKAMIVPVLVQWIANAIAVLLFPYAFNQIGRASTFFVLAAMAFLQILFAWRVVPETKNKTLEEIENVWR